VGIVRKIKKYRLETKRWLVVREPGEWSPRILSTPEAVASLARDLLCKNDDEQEHFWVIFVNAQNHYQNVYEVSVGTMTASLVHPREVFRWAIQEGAVGVILLHNHPSGDPTPSSEDKRLTQQLVEAGKILEIKVHDHVIMGNGSEQWVSLAQRGAM